MSDTARADGWSTTWSDLWRTPDQQGQAMLDAGEPAPAAARFHDPRRRAYADLQVGRYGQAAKLLAPFADAASEYNRGNALAESGQLPAALAAYDAALKLTPADADVRHNRDVVERVLRQQRQSPRNGPGAHRPGARSSRSAGGGRMAGTGSRADSGHSGSSGQQPNAPQATAERRGGSSKEAPGQARRDAAFAAAVAHAQRQERANAGPEDPSKSTGRGPDTGRLVAARTMPKQKPGSERQLDQWLQQIPDSPAGLLQRQFLIEHTMRQQGGAD